MEQLYLRGDYNELLTRTSSIGEIITIDELQAMFWRGMTLWNLGKLTHSQNVVKHMETTIDHIFDKNSIEIKRILSQLYRLKGHIAGYNEIDPSIHISHYQKALELAEEIHDKILIHIGLHNLGSAYSSTGNFMDGLRYFERAYTLAKQAENIAGLAFNYASRSEIHLLLGNIEQGFELATKLKQIVSKEKINELVHASNISFGRYYLHIGDFQISVDHFNRAINTSKIQNESFAHTLDYIIEPLILLGKIDEAKYYFKILERLHEQKKSIRIYQIYITNKALLLAESTKFKDKAESLELFDEVLEYCYVFTLVSKAFQGKINLLIQQLILHYDEGIISEIYSNIDKMEDIASKQSNYLQIIRLYILKSKVSVLEKKPGEAIKILDNGINFANTKGLTTLRETLKHLKQEIENDLIWWEDFLMHNYEMFHKLKMEGIRTYIANAQNQVDQIEN